jgi:ABC-type glycerol-3-phosphate transport system permease component
MRKISAVILLLAIAFPVYWALVSSVTPEAELYGRATPWPASLTLAHYRALFEQRDFWVPIRSSIIVAATTTVFCIVLGSLTAYALARLDFPAKKPILSAILAVSMFPQVAIVSPLYLFLRELGLINTYPGLILPYLTFAMPLTVWLLVGYFRQLPLDLEEAAMIDGASRLRTLREIVLPLAVPAIATTAVLTFVYCWNEFLFALAFTTGFDRQTVPVAVSLFRGHYRVPWGEILAAAMVATIPVVLLVLVFQRRIVSGLTAGAVK